MKRMLSLVLCFFMVIAAVPIVSATDTYTISNAAELKAFLNSTDTFESVTVKLTDNISVYDGVFSVDENNNPSYNGSSVLPEVLPSLKNFCGTFDGQNYTISGLYMNSGLFENCVNADIKNLYIINSLVVNKSNSYNGLGTICSALKNSKITGCSVDAIVIGSGNYTGGVLGNASGSTVKYCRNIGKVFGGTYVGGVAGSFNNCTVSACYNSADINSASYAGGFAGIISGCKKVEFSYNIGDVTATDEKGVAGGFAGLLAPAQSNSNSVSYIYTVGEISGENIGKFCGEFSGLFEEIFELYCCSYLGSTIEEFDSEGFVADLWGFYQENPSIMYPDDGLYYPAVIYNLSVYPTTNENLKNPNYGLYSEFVADAANENEGYHMLKYFHKAHSFSEYTINEDGTALVAKCNSKNCPETDSKTHIHTWGEYIYNGDATCQTAGTMTAVCTDKMCGMSNTVADPYHPISDHTWGEYIYNHDATCITSGTMTATCIIKGCGKKNTVPDTEHTTEEHNFGEYVLDESGLTETAHCKTDSCQATDTIEHKHAWGSYTYNNDADCENDGTKTASCTNKNCKVTNTVKDINYPATGHNMSEYILDENGLTETARCQNKGCTEINTVVHRHTWSEYAYNNDANCENNGTMTAACIKDGCNATNTVVDFNHPATNHSFGEYILDESGLTETAICLNKDCHKTDTINHIHIWGEYVYNGDANCETNGTKTAHCTKSGCDVTDTVSDGEHLMTGHSFGVWQANGDAKFFRNGTETRICACGIEETREDDRSAIIIVIFDTVFSFIVSLFK